jgi:hypothetical protein
VLLRSCVLKPTGGAQQDFDIDLGDDVELNPVLEHYLRSEQGIELDAEALEEMATLTKGFDPHPCSPRSAGCVNASRRSGSRHGWCWAPSPTPSCRWWPTLRPSS